MTLIKLFIKNFERVEKNAEGTSAGPRSQPRPCGAPRLPPVRVSGRLPPHAPALGQSFPRECFSFKAILWTSPHLLAGSDFC